MSSHKYYSGSQHQWVKNYVLYTCDLQLYKVAQSILWAYPDRFKNVVLRLGGMHMLMSFIGAVGSLMVETGLNDILESVFGGVNKMLTGKKFPQNMRALRLVMEEVLRSLVEREGLTSYHNLLEILEELCQKSKTSRLWVDCLIKPVFIMMQYVRAEQ